MDGINGNKVESMELMGEWMLWMGMGEFAGVDGEGWNGWNGWDSNYGMDGIVRMDWT